MKRIAVIGAVLENPRQSRNAFNDTVSEFRGIIRGRMGIPFEEENAAVIAITLLGELDEINALTGKLGNLPGVTAKTAVSNALPEVRGLPRETPPSAAGGVLPPGPDKREWREAERAVQETASTGRKAERAGDTVLKGEDHHV